VLASGDFVIWVFPNAGNPRKVQRYAPDWAAALRRMEALQPEVLIPGHGPVILGAARAAQVLRGGAEVLESLVRQILALINQGRSLDEILHAVSAARRAARQPYLLPKYDDPEFVVRGIWRLYAGWFDGNPAHLKPAPAAELAADLASLAGGEDKPAERAKALAQAGKTRLAAHLIELASTASPASADIQAVRARVYAQCVSTEASLIGKAIFEVYRRDAEARSSA
jgi:alkyl sulfatase BDS1-like metallo-beta-lactamase superfamily hydrolase